MPEQPQRMMGFDFGTKKIGVAIGQQITRQANALTVVFSRHGEPDWQAIEKLITHWQPETLIVGRPLNMDGTTQLLTQLAEKFAGKLHKRYHLPVVMVDERLSTIAARANIFAEGGYRALQQKKTDAVAAQIILQDWLDQL